MSMYAPLSAIIEKATEAAIYSAGSFVLNKFVGEDHEVSPEDAVRGKLGFAMEATSVAVDRSKDVASAIVSSVANFSFSSSPSTSPSSTILDVARMMGGTDYTDEEQRLQASRTRIAQRNAELIARSGGRPAQTLKPRSVPKVRKP